MSGNTAHLSLLSRGVGEVKVNGHEKVDVVLEPEDYFNYTQDQGRMYLPPIQPKYNTYMDTSRSQANSVREVHELYMPKTFITRKGALLLFSEDYASKTRSTNYRPHEAEDFNAEDGLNTVEDLSRSILSYGNRKESEVNLFVYDKQRTPRKFRPGYSAKRYLSRLTRSFDDTFLDKLLSSGFVSEKTLFHPNALLPHLRRRINDDLSSYPTPYRVMKHMLLAPGVLSGYTFYTGIPDQSGIADLGEIKEEDDVARSDKSGKLEIIDTKDGIAKSVTYSDLSKEEKEQVLADLLVKSAINHALEKQKQIIDEGDQQEAQEDELEEVRSRRQSAYDQQSQGLDMTEAVKSYIESQASSPAQQDQYSDTSYLTPRSFRGGRIPTHSVKSFEVNPFETLPTIPSKGEQVKREKAPRRKPLPSELSGSKEYIGGIPVASLKDTQSVSSYTSSIKSSSSFSKSSMQESYAPIQAPPLSPIMDVNSEAYGLSREASLNPHMPVPPIMKANIHVIDTGLAVPGLSIQPPTPQASNLTKSGETHQPEGVGDTFSEKAEDTGRSSVSESVSQDVTTATESDSEAFRHKRHRKKRHMGRTASVQSLGEGSMVPAGGLHMASSTESVGQTESVRSYNSYSMRGGALKKSKAAVSVTSSKRDIRDTDSIQGTVVFGPEGEVIKVGESLTHRHDDTEEGTEQQLQEQEPIGPEIDAIEEANQDLAERVSHIAEGEDIGDKLEEEDEQITDTGREKPSSRAPSVASKMSGYTKNMREIDLSGGDLDATQSIKTLGIKGQDQPQSISHRATPLSGQDGLLHEHTGPHLAQTHPDYGLNSTKEGTFQDLQTEGQGETMETEVNEAVVGTRESTKITSKARSKQASRASESQPQEGSEVQREATGLKQGSRQVTGVEDPASREATIASHLGTDTMDKSGAPTLGDRSPPHQALVMGDTMSSIAMTTKQHTEMEKQVTGTSLSGGSRSSSRALSEQELVDALSEHAQKIAETVLSRPETGDDLAKDAQHAAKLWLEDNQPNQLSASQSMQDLRDTALLEEMALERQGSQSAGPTVDEYKELLKETLATVVSKVSGDAASDLREADVSPDLVEALANQEINVEDIEIKKDEDTGRTVIRAKSGASSVSVGKKSQASRRSSRQSLVIDVPSGEIVGKQPKQGGSNTPKLQPTPPITPKPPVSKTPSKEVSMVIPETPEDKGYVANDESKSPPKSRKSHSKSPKKSRSPTKLSKEHTKISHGTPLPDNIEEELTMELEASSREVTMDQTGTPEKSMVKTSKESSNIRKSSRKSPSKTPGSKSPTKTPSREMSKATKDKTIISEETEKKGDKPMVLEKTKITLPSERTGTSIAQEVEPPVKAPTREPTIEAVEGEYTSTSIARSVTNKDPSTLSSKQPTDIQPASKEPSAVQPGTPMAASKGSTQILASKEPSLVAPLKEASSVAPTKEGTVISTVKEATASTIKTSLHKQSTDGKLSKEPTAVPPSKENTLIPAKDATILTRESTKLSKQPTMNEPPSEETKERSKHKSRESRRSMQSRDPTQLTKQDTISSADPSLTASKQPSSLTRDNTLVSEIAGASRESTQGVMESRGKTRVPGESRVPTRGQGDSKDQTRGPSIIPTKSNTQVSDDTTDRERTTLTDKLESSVSREQTSDTLVDNSGSEDEATVSKGMIGEPRGHTMPKAKRPSVTKKPDGDGEKKDLSMDVINYGEADHPEGEKSEVIVRPERERKKSTAALSQKSGKGAGDDEDAKFREELENLVEGRKSSVKSGKSAKSQTKSKTPEDREEFVVGKVKETKQLETLYAPLEEPPKPVEKKPRVPAAKPAKAKKTKKKVSKKEEKAPEKEDEKPEAEVKAPTPPPKEEEVEKPPAPEPTPSPQPTVVSRRIRRKYKQTAARKKATKAKGKRQKKAPSPEPEKEEDIEFVIVREEFSDDDDDDDEPVRTKSVKSYRSFRSIESKDTDMSDKTRDSDMSEETRLRQISNRDARAAKRAAAAAKKREEMERKRKEREDKVKKDKEMAERMEQLQREQEEERRQREEERRMNRAKQEEEARRKEAEEQRREDREKQEIEREKRLKEEYNRKREEMQLKKMEEDRKRKELEEQRRLEEEERAKEEAEMMAKMEEDERIEYEKRKAEEAELLRLKQEADRIKREDDAAKALEEAKRLAEEMARKQLELERKLAFNRSLQLESTGLSHTQEITRAFVWSYYELLKWLGFELPEFEKWKATLKY